MQIALPVDVDNNNYGNSGQKSPKTPRDIAAPHQLPLSQNNSASSLPNTNTAKSSPSKLEHVDFRNFSFPKLEPLSQIKYDNYVGPTLESNWVIPGVLLVGAYPASQDDNETFQLITSILNQGVTKFVCLQQEYRGTGVSEAMWRSGQALRPYFDDVKLIVKNKARFEVFKNHRNIVSEERLSFVHFPIRDCGITDDAGVLQLCRSLVRAISEGEVIYLHCWGGHGRTGTVLCIMLHLMYGLNAKDAMVRCQTVHDLRVYPVEVGSPQTQQQRDQVTRVINKLIAESSQSAPVMQPSIIPATSTTTFASLNQHSVNHANVNQTREAETTHTKNSGGSSSNLNNNSNNNSNMNLFGSYKLFKTKKNSGHGNESTSTSKNNHNQHHHQHHSQPQQQQQVQVAVKSEVVEKSTVPSTTQAAHPPVSQPPPSNTAKNHNQHRMTSQHQQQHQVAADVSGVLVVETCQSEVDIDIQVDIEVCNDNGHHVLDSNNMSSDNDDEQSHAHKKSTFPHHHSHINHQYVSQGMSSSSSGVTVANNDYDYGNSHDDSHGHGINNDVADSTSSHGHGHVASPSTTFSTII